MRLLGPQRLRTLPCLLIDDAQMLGRYGRALVAIVGARHTPARLRVFDHAHLVPHDPAGIKLIEDDAVATRGIAVDRRSIPLVAARWCNAFAVETSGDLARRPAGVVFGKDASHDGSLVRNDVELALDAWARPVAIGATAGVPAGPHDARHAAAHLLGAVFPEKLADESAQADHDCVSLPFVHGAQLDAGEGQPLVDTGKVLHVARKAIERFHDDDVEASRLGLRHEVDETVATEDRSAGAGLVLKSDDRGQMLASAISAAERDLIVNRPFVLQIGGKPSVDRGARHRGPFLSTLSQSDDRAARQRPQDS